MQNHYNLVHRDDDALIDELAGTGIAYVPFFPLGGFTRLQSSTLSEAAKQLGATPMHRAPNILLIPGTSSNAHLHENLAAAELALSDEVLASLDAIGYGDVFTRRLRAMGIRDRPIAPRSPWQNGYVETCDPLDPTRVP